MHDRWSGTCNWDTTSVCQLWWNVFPDIYYDAFYFGEIGCRQADGVEIISFLPMLLCAYVVNLANN
jgi:hypothetical protein